MPNPELIGTDKGKSPGVEPCILFHDVSKDYGGPENIRAGVYQPGEAYLY